MLFLECGEVGEEVEDEGDEKVVSHFGALLIPTESSRDLNPRHTVLLGAVFLPILLASLDK